MLYHNHACTQHHESHIKTFCRRNSTELLMLSCWSVVMTIWRQWETQVRSDICLASAQETNKRYSSTNAWIIIEVVFLSVRLSVSQPGGSVKNGESYRITKFSPSAAAWKTSVSESAKLFDRGHQSEGAKWEGGRKNLRFSVNKLLYLRNGARIIRTRTSNLVTPSKCTLSAAQTAAAARNRFCPGVCK